MPGTEQRPADALAGGLARRWLPVAYGRATPDGLCVLDVWESPEKFQAFGQQLMPLAQQAGLKPDEPVIFPAHNFVNQ